MEAMAKMCSPWTWKASDWSACSFKLVVAAKRPASTGPASRSARVVQDEQDPSGTEERSESSTAEWEPENSGSPCVWKSPAQGTRGAVTGAKIYLIPTPSMWLRYLKMLLQRIRLLQAPGRVFPVLPWQVRLKIDIGTTSRTSSSRASLILRPTTNGIRSAVESGQYLVVPSSASSARQAPGGRCRGRRRHEGGIQSRVLAQDLRLQFA